MKRTRQFLAGILIYSVLAAQTSTALPAEANTALPLPTTGNVTLSLAEYNRLVDLAAKSVKKLDQPPIPYTIKRAELKLRAGNDSVLGTVSLDGEVFSKGEAKVPLTSGMTILNAQQAGRTLPLLQEGQTATAVLPGQSDFSVSLDAGLPLAIEAGRASFNLPVPAAGSVRLSLAIPGDHTNVRISPGLITSRSSEKGQTLVEAALVPGQTASVWWTTREVVAPVAPKEVRFLSEVKTLVSVSESDLKIGALCDVTLLQGQPARFTVSVPQNFEITDVAGTTVESSEIDGGTLTIHLSSGSQKSHQFLITMERALNDSKADAPLISFNGAQRETGEVLVEGIGAMELTAKEGGSLKRMDVKEVSPYLRGLAHAQLQAAFRYHRQPNDRPTLALNWTRFPDSAVLAAIAEHAVVTTLVTSEGRSLTEVTLTVKNQAQPFMKVNLPAGASILTADVAGEKVKPVQGPDGNRVPLLRANFRPTNAYAVSYVYMESGTPFEKKGGAQISLPSMDVPISVMEWEVFLPERYKVKDFGGDAIAENLLPTVIVNASDLAAGGPMLNVEPTVFAGAAAPQAAPLLPGGIGGTIVDPQGAVVAGATVKVTNVDRGVSRTTTTDSYGTWSVPGVPAGNIRIEAESQGFMTSVANISHDGLRATRQDFHLNVASTTETVEVTSSGSLIETGRKKHRDEKKDQAAQQSQASANVYNLQKRVAGVLPVRVDVPRAGTSYRFARALVLDEQTKLTFNYKTR